MEFIKFSPPDISEDEINLVSDSLKSGWITTGPQTKLFEKNISEFCNTQKTACLNSATSCMELTLRLLGIGEGDEVITSAYTYTASCSVICHVGATPILIDTQVNSIEMDYDALENAITPKTKAIIPVDIAGIMCDYNKIFEIVNRKKNIFKTKNTIQKSMNRICVIADSAHAFGANFNNKICGEVADFTCFSFHAVKNLTTAEGGAVTWNNIKGISDEEIYKEYMLLSLHGQNKDALEKNLNGNWEYDIIYPGYKCNMTDIAASIGLAQLKRYNHILNKRRTIIEKYDNGFKDTEVIHLNHYSRTHKSSGHLYILRLKGKDEKFRNNVITKMNEKGIITNVHYKPLPMFTAYKNMGFNIKNFSNAFNLYKNSITLPLHTLLTDQDINYIIKSLKESLK